MPASEIQVTIGPVSFNTSLSAVPMYLLTSTEEILDALRTRRTDTPKQGDHGSEDSPSQYEPRLLLFRGEIHASTQSERVTMQQALDKAVSLSRSQSFAGDDGYKLVEIVDEDGVEKMLYAKIDQMPKYELIEEGMPESRRFEFVMFASDPAVYAQELIEEEGMESYFSTTFTIQDGALPTFQDGDLPTFQDTIGAKVTIDNPGTWASPPLIVVHGPSLDPVITNESTGQKMEFSRNGGLTLADGESLIINCAARTAVVGIVNVRSKLSLDSNWLNIVPGENEVYLSDETPGELDSQMDLSFRPAWV